MSAPRPPGRVITFYSYKGGTGRSMALANIAWILAAAGKRVLAIDWDLEAPGLHRYFRPFLIDQELASSDGLLDLVDRYAAEAVRPLPELQTPAPDWWAPLSDFSEHVLSLNFPHFPAGGKIDLLPAGRQNDAYAVKVSAFNWANFYDRLGGGGFMDAVRERARRDYDYVLIDSRTGVSDTAGICSAQMPDTLVVCFTYNNQSIKGAAAVAASARARHAQVEAERARRAGAGGPDIAPSAPFRVLPVPMRVDAGESDRLALRQAFARQAFGPLLDTASDVEAAEYWNAVEVPHRVFYAYEEVLAPLKDEASDPKTVLAAFVRLTRFLSEGDVGHYRLPLAPEVRQAALEAFAETPQTAAAHRARDESVRETAQQAMVREADAALLALPEDTRQLARRALCRLVRVGRDEEGGGVFPIRVALSEFDAAQRGVLNGLAGAGLLALTSEVRGSATGVPETVVGFARERIVLEWPMLRRWLAEDREFLVWRQQLRDYRVDWARSGDRSALLGGSLLGEARLWSRRRPQDLNAAEHDFIQASIDAAEAATPSALPAPSSTLQPDGGEVPTGHLGIARAAGGGLGGRWAVAAVIAALVGAAAVWALWPARRAPAPTVAASAPLSPSPVATAPPVVPPTPEQLRAEAERLLEAGQTAAAVDAYGRLVRADATGVAVVLNQARAADRSGDYATSAALYDLAVQARPEDPQPRIDRAASLATQRRFEAALADLNEALRLDPRNALAWLNRGVVHENLGRRDDALADYGRAIEWNAGLADAYLRRGLLQEKGSPAAARADYQAVLGLSPDAASAQTAQERLKVLSPRLRPDPRAPAGQSTPRVVLQYSDAGDRGRVDALRYALQAELAPAQVPLGEKVSARGNGDVRYFFPDDKALAERVARATELALARQGVTVRLRPQARSAKEFPRAAPGTVEVWLPPLSVVAPVRAPLKAN